MHSKDLRCFKCQQGSTARGIKSFRCVRCQTLGVTGIDYGGVCGTCADELGICIKCGRTIDKDSDRLKEAVEYLVDSTVTHPQLTHAIKIVTRFVTETLEKQER